MEPWYEIKYRIHKLIDNIIHPFRVIWYTVRNFFYWGWVLRNDRNWDYYYLYVILEKKLILIRKSLGNGLIAEEEKESIFPALDRAIELCKRLKDQDYSENYDKIEKKWGGINLAFNPSEHPHGYFWYKKAIYPNEQEEAEIDFLEAFRLDDKMHRKEREEFFEILSDNIQKWWD